MFGRLLDVYVAKANGESLKIVDSSMGENTLVCKGTIERYYGTDIDTCIINIYNLGSIFRGKIVTDKYDYLIVKFAYEDNGRVLSTIFEGNIQRLLFKRDDEVTDITTIYAWESGDFSKYGFYSATYADGVNYYQIAQDICNSSTEKIPCQLAEELKNYKVRGSKTFYGSSVEALYDIANETGVNLVLKNGKVYATPNDDGTENVIMYTSQRTSDNRIVSNSGLIGIPTLENDGLSFKALINPELSILSLVQIDNSIISIGQSGFVPNVSTIGANLDRDGLYRVVRFTTKFSNDSSDSYTQVTALSREMYKEISTQ